MIRDTRPVFLNLFLIHYPVAAILSIIHRMTGVYMVFITPWYIYLFALSVHNSHGFNRATELLLGENCFFLIFMLVGLLWSLLHHFMAGIRYLFLDIDVGVDNKIAQRSALIIMILDVFGFIVLLSWGASIRGLL